MGAHRDPAPDPHRARGFGATGASKTELKLACGDIKDSTYYENLNELVKRGWIIKTDHGRTAQLTLPQEPPEWAR